MKKNCRAVICFLSSIVLLYGFGSGPKPGSIATGDQPAQASPETPTEEEESVPGEIGPYTRQLPEQNVPSQPESPAYQQGPIEKTPSEAPYQVSRPGVIKQQHLPPKHHTYKKPGAKIVPAGPNVQIHTSEYPVYEQYATVTTAVTNTAPK